MLLFWDIAYYYIFKVGFLYNINIVNLIYKVELAETEISIFIHI